MRIEAVVVNASPLISLFRSGQADLLPRLFNRIGVPEAVWKEVTLDERDDAAARDWAHRLGRFARTWWLHHASRHGTSRLARRQF